MLWIFFVLRDDNDDSINLTVFSVCIFTVLLVLDACFSGHVFDTQTQPNRIDDADELIQVYQSNCFASVSAMTACSEAEYAMEGGKDMSNGFFTRSIEAALSTVDRERLVLDGEKDKEVIGFVLGNELFRSIKKNVRGITTNMTPQYLCIEHEHWGQKCKGDFIFYIPGGFGIGAGGGRGMPTYD